MFPIILIVGIGAIAVAAAAAKKKKPLVAAPATITRVPKPPAVPKGWIKTTMTMTDKMGTSTVYLAPTKEGYFIVARSNIGQRLVGKLTRDDKAKLYTYAATGGVSPIPSAMVAKHIAPKVRPAWKIVVPAPAAAPAPAAPAAAPAPMSVAPKPAAPAPKPAPRKVLIRTVQAVPGKYRVIAYDAKNPKALVTRTGDFPTAAVALESMKKIAVQMNLQIVGQAPASSPVA
jgi:hypothetical protein